MDLSGLAIWEAAMSARDHDVADVLIVGSGATGAIAAMVLGQAGLKVVPGAGRVDRGARPPHASGDWQWQRRTRWSPDVNVRRGNQDDFPVRSNSSQVLMWNGVGGSTNVYGALWPRYRPSDFRKGRSGLAPDWPITYEDLAPITSAPTASSASAACGRPRRCRRRTPTPHRQCRSGPQAGGSPGPSTVWGGTGGRCRPG